MSGRTPRIIGTTDEAIKKAEAELHFRFPPSFRNWLIKNNGFSIDGIDSNFPVYDERNPRKTWDSIVRNYKENWLQWADIFGEAFDFSHLLPFGEFGNGDFYCFDYSEKQIDGEVLIVLWSHETGEIVGCAGTFDEFLVKARNGEYELD